ncbi:hypothetical protein K7W03_25680 [Sphingobium sp. PNB]|uniref:hypothetical protein n=1 Tax=Sphingobium sp. PNB TaxID=863934 RepID=UPI001CA45184|nr:hypothetical protein [Sphingobium sp. PNB]MCB4862977.1 hypothetical protein [Sphingobium sp. PNB]
MSDIEIRLECLRLANAGFGERPEDIVARARAYHVFLTGKSDQTPRQIIDAALDKAGVSRD